MHDDEWDVNPPALQGRPNYRLIIGINFAIMLVLQTLATVSGTDNYAAGKAFLLCLQVAVNLFVSLLLLLSRDTRSTGIAFLLAALLVAVVGFGTCVALHDMAGMPPGQPGPPVKQ